MADRSRIVTFDRGGRVQTVFDLQDGDGYNYVRDSFAFAPPERKPRMVASNNLYGGSTYHGGLHENGSVKAELLVAGASEDQALARAAALVDQFDAFPDKLYYEWRPDGATYSTYWEIRGPAKWTPQYKWIQFSGTNSMVIAFEWPVAPLGQGDPMDIRDYFDLDTRADYTADAGSTADLAITSNALAATANLDAEKRLIHTARGYKHGDCEVILKVTPGTTIDGFKAGAILRRFSADTYIECYVDDDGVNSRLRIDTVIGGARVNLWTFNLTARIVSGTPFWIRARGFLNHTYAFNASVSYYMSEPTPLGASTKDVTYSLTTGTFYTAQTTLGDHGFSWIPKHTNARIDNVAILPFSYAITNRFVRHCFGTVYGDADALADVSIATSGGSAAPAFAQLAWGDQSLSDARPFRTWPDIGAVGYDVTPVGFDPTTYQDTTATSAETYQISLVVDPNEMFDDPDTPGQLLLEVWMRVRMSSTLVTPRVIGSIYGDAVAPETFTIEHGSAGRVLTVPSSGMQLRRVKVGTLPLRVGEVQADGTHALQVVRVQMPLGAGSSGTWGFASISLVPATRTASSDSAKPLDAYYPVFARVTTESVKTVRHDLSAIVSASGVGGMADHGLGGNLIELPPGDIDFFALVSDAVPDDPTSNATSETSNASGWTHIAVTPRYKFARTS